MSSHVENHAFGESGRATTVMSGADQLSIVIAKLIRRAATYGVESDVANECIARAVTVLRAASATSGEAAPRAPTNQWHGGLSPRHLERVLTYIHANMESQVRAGDLPGVVKMSASHLSRAFKISVGVSPSTYLAAKRVERACEMMTLSDEPLSNIALACGLSDQSHFCRIFRRFVGVSPGVWRHTRVTGAGYPVTSETRA